MVRSQDDWPEWWEWDLDLSLDHLRDQMVRRKFSETELRDMLEQATGFCEDDEVGRWLVQTTRNGKTWAVIVEPQPRDRSLLVITAYMIEQM
jgi:hypothetical protein